MAIELPKGVKSFKKFCADVVEYVYESRPLPGANVTVDEMPDGRVVNAKPGGTPLEVAMAVWPGPTTKLVRVGSFGERAVPEVEA